MVMKSNSAGGTSPFGDPKTLRNTLQVLSEYPELTDTLIATFDAVHKKGSDITEVSPRLEGNGFNIYLEEIPAAVDGLDGTARRQKFDHALDYTAKAIEAAKGIIDVQTIECTDEMARSGFGPSPLKAVVKCQIKR